MFSPYNVSDGKIVEAIRRIHLSSPADVGRNTLDELAAVFGFDYLLFAACLVAANGEIRFEGKYCGGGAPGGLVEATRRVCAGPIESQDILCYVRHLQKIIRVDPLDGSMLAAKLHRDTVATFRFEDPIYFIPLLDRNKNVRAVIHASLPRQKDPGYGNSTFLYHLEVLANNAGVAIENHELHKRFDNQTREREALLTLTQNVESLESLQDKYSYIVTILTYGGGFRFNCAIFFVASVDGDFECVSAVLPGDSKEFQKIGDAVAEWTIDKFLENRETYERQAKAFANKGVRLSPGFPVAKAIDDRKAQIIHAYGVPDPQIVELIPELRVFTPYVILPLVAQGMPLGFVYLDNRFTGEMFPEQSELDLLAERTASIVARAKRDWYKQQRTEAFASLIKETAQIIGEDFDLAELFAYLVRAAGLLGARRACVVMKDVGQDWRIAATSQNWATDSNTWRRALRESQNNEGWASLVVEYKESNKSSTREILATKLPFSVLNTEAAICIEPQLGIPRSELVDALGTLAAFASAVLIAAERSRFLATDARFFATRLMQMTAHESKNVLNTVLWALNDFEAERSRMSPKAQKKLEDAQERVTTGIESLEAYLTLLKTSALEDTSDNMWTPFTMCAAHCISLIKPRAAKRNRDIERIFKIDADECELKISRINLLVVLFNLLSNAVKATVDVDQPQITVECRFDDERSIAVVRVVDNGISVTKDERAKLSTPGYSGFSERFAKTGRVELKLHRSSGVGLTTVQTIVETEHGGKFRLNSLPTGAEAIFTIAARPIRHDH